LNVSNHGNESLQCDSRFSVPQPRQSRRSSQKPSPKKVYVKVSSIAGMDADQNLGLYSHTTVAAGDTVLTTRGFYFTNATKSEVDVGKAMKGRRPDAAVIMSCGTKTPGVFVPDRSIYADPDENMKLKYAESEWYRANWSKDPNMYLAKLDRKAPDSVSFETRYGEQLSYPAGAMRASIVFKTLQGFKAEVELCWGYGCNCAKPHANYTGFKRAHYGKSNQVLWPTTEGE
jgi:hypothetical protein